MEIKIKTKSKAEKIAVTAFLYGMGYMYEGYDSFSDLVQDEDDGGHHLKNNYASFPHVYIEYGVMDSLCFCTTDHDTLKTFNWSTQFDAILKELTKPSNTMRLTDDYSANIVDGGIQVGCQFIDFETFDELVELVNANRN